ncbi:transcription elongation factor A protein 3-like [Branchiostoma floridae]|uniref:Transcription elongation factor A protein 3-like n=1 Tax=Branchiostoma floridae TaxID=7739 RepID=A0A9J7HEH0_BRAFL|nr:transcription elongation factor A protein 3-like [Branchiostoma floridae]
MADSEETRLISISTQLNAMVSEGKTDDTITILRSLRDEDISVRLLKETQIGRAVNNVRRNSSNEEVISLAKKIVNKWRRSAESQYSSVVAATGELPCSQMSQMTEETQMSQTQDREMAGLPKTKVHHEKERSPGEKETELTQESQSVLQPSITGALPLFQTEAPDDDRGTGLDSTHGKNDEKEQEQESDRETSHKEGQDNLLSQQTQQSNHSDRQNPDELCQSNAGNNTSTTIGNVEGSHANSSDGEMQLERGSDYSNSQQTHLFCCNPNKERKDGQNLQASVPVEQVAENPARTDKDTEAGCAD